MNAFLRNIEAQRLRERDEQMATLRGKDLPKVRPDCLDANEARELAMDSRREAVRALYEEGLSAKEIAERLGLNVAQVKRVSK